MRSEEAVKAEVHELWRAVHGEAPAAEAPAGALLDLLVAGLPLPGYDTIHRLGSVSPYPVGDPRR